MQVRTVAGAGVPLAEIGAILDAAALVDIEQSLTARIEELIARREMLRRCLARMTALIEARLRSAGIDVP